MTQTYKNLFPDTTSASIPAVIMLRSTLSMHVFLINISFLTACFVDRSPEAIFLISFYVARRAAQPRTMDLL
jgi:hypothetical protein